MDSPNQSNVMVSDHKPRLFLSLRWKFVLITALFLIALNGVFAGLMYATLIEQYAQQRETNFRKYSEHLNGILQQSQENLLQTSELIPLLSGMAESLKTEAPLAVQKTFAKHWGDLQLRMNIDSAELYSTAGKRLVGRSDQPLHECPTAPLTEFVNQVNETEQPLALLDCTGACREYAFTPMLVDGKHVGLSVVGTSLAELSLHFHQVTGADIAILSTSSACKREQMSSEQMLSNWQARILAVTFPSANLPLLERASIDFPDMAKLRKGIQVIHARHTYELRTIPIPAAKQRGSGQYLIIEDVTAYINQIHRSVQFSILIGITGLILSSLIILTAQWRGMSRLRVIDRVLPWLADSAFDQLRMELGPHVRQSGLSDEVDNLGHSILSTSHRLERLQTQEQQAREALNQRVLELANERDFTAHLLNAAQVIICTLDQDLRIKSINHLGTTLIGKAEQELIGHNIGEYLSSAEPSSLLDARLRELFDEVGSVYQHESQLRGPEGNNHQIAWLHSSVSDRGGDSLMILSVGLDVTQRKEAESRLTWLADHDPLTGLGNRRRLLQDLEQAAAQAMRHHHTGGLLILNLDNFKYINDTHGHAAGDKVLRQIGNILSYHIQGGDILARIGADEFAIILAECPLQVIQRLADKFVRTVADNPINWNQSSLSTTVSIGVTLFPIHAETAQELMSYADAAMLRAKQNGGNRAHLFDPVKDTEGRLQEQRFWQDRIRKGLTNTGFELFFQPIANTQTLDISHYEVLLRIRNQDGSLSGPMDLIKAAEKSGQILELDQFVMEQAMLRLAAITEDGRDLRFSINVSGPSLQDLTLPGRIEDLLAQTGVDPERIIFEVTETAAVSDIYAATQIMEQIIQFGCHFALDDFGVGFSSFYYLRELPIHYVKIDGSFIRSLNEREDDQAVVRALTDIARGFGKKTIAEFVENQEILNLLRAFGVDYAQGYFIGKPAPDILPDKK